MKNVSLPYADNAKAVLITLAINLAAVFLFNRPRGVTYTGVMWDSLICAFVTTAADISIVYSALKKIRAAGGMPARVPVSRLMQRLPTHPLALGLTYAVAFGALTVAANAAILRFFGVRSMAFAPWAVYKLVYSTLLSVKITEYCIFRYVQPDWANAGTAGVSVQNGLKPVRNPLPKISVFKEIYGSVTGNIAMNIIIGSLLGGVAARPDGSVVIRATTAEGIPITGLVFGLLAGILVTDGILKEMNKAILMSGAAAPGDIAADKRFAWLPVKKGALTCLVCVFLMLFSAAALRAIMTLFGIPVMNFYQFTVLISIYATIISKPLACVLIRRCVQPDYIRYTLRGRT